MKFLALVSSYRKNGNTARLAGLLSEALKTQAERAAEPLEIETLNLAHLQIQPCRGCRVCFDRGETHCPLKDDLAAIKAKMRAADGVIVAGPVYVEDVNGIMKTWIDRLAYICHRPEFAGKYAYLLTTTGVGSTGHALQTLNTALRTWGFYIIGQKNFTTGHLMPGAEMQAHFQDQIDGIARKIVGSLRQKKAANPSFLSLMTFRIQQKYWLNGADGSLDYVYWFSNGWTDPRRDYYIPHAASALKATLARWAGLLLARFVL